MPQKRAKMTMQKGFRSDEMKALGVMAWIAWPRVVLKISRMKTIRNWNPARSLAV